MVKMEKKIRVLIATSAAGMGVNFNFEVEQQLISIRLSKYILLKESPMNQYKIGEKCMWWAHLNGHIVLKRQ